MAVFRTTLFVCVLVSLSVVGNAATVEDQEVPATAQTVDLVVYYESMCPYCRNFITNQLYPTFQKLGSTVLNLTMVPYGNAKEAFRNNEWLFACQHGHVECLGNAIQACALNITDYDPDMYMPFVNCMETNTRHGQEMTALHTCGNSFNVSESAVIGCLRSDMGWQIEHQMALLTEKAHVHYVPWLEINGVHPRTSAPQKELLPYLCNYIKNDNCPKATVIG